MPNASNYTLLARVVGTSEPVHVVYKPILGESPLWDFPYATLALREVAAFELSDRAGFGFVPCTVIRSGPLGVGSVQVFIEHDPSVTSFTLEEERAADLRRVALFDLVVNNADRKGGHVLRDDQGAIWAVDHGVCFHPRYKLRTVLWSWVEAPFEQEERAILERVCSDLKGEYSEALRRYLSPQEISAMVERVENLLERGTFPAPGPGRHYPWPPV